MINRRFVVVVLASLALDAGVAAAAVTVAIGSAAGTPGQMVELGATLTADAQDPVAGVENDLNFAPAASVAVGADGRPDCSLNPAIRKSATAFSFRPLGCDPQAGQCTAITHSSSPSTTSTPFHRVQFFTAVESPFLGKRNQVAMHSPSPTRCTHRQTVVTTPQMGMTASSRRSEAACRLRPAMVAAVARLAQAGRGPRCGWRLACWPAGAFAVPGMRGERGVDLG